MTPAALPRNKIPLKLFEFELRLFLWLLECWGEEWHLLCEEHCSHCQDQWKIVLDLMEVLGEIHSHIPLEKKISYTGWRLTHYSPSLIRPPKHHLFISSPPSGDPNHLPVYSEGRDAYSALISSWKFAGMAGATNNPFIFPGSSPAFRGLIGFLSSILGCTKVLQISLSASNKKLAFSSSN